MSAALHPEIAEPDGEALPVGVLDRVVALALEDQAPRLTVEPEALEAAAGGVEEPEVGDTEGGVAPGLGGPVVGHGGGGEHRDQEGGRALDSAGRDLLEGRDDDEVR